MRGPVSAPRRRAAGRARARPAPLQSELNLKAPWTWDGGRLAPAVRRGCVQASPTSGHLIPPPLFPTVWPRGAGPLLARAGMPRLRARSGHETGHLRSPGRACQHAGLHATAAGRPSCAARQHRGVRRLPGARPGRLPGAPSPRRPGRLRPGAARRLAAPGRRPVRTGRGLGRGGAVSASTGWPGCRRPCRCPGARRCRTSRATRARLPGRGGGGRAGAGGAPPGGHRAPGCAGLPLPLTGGARKAPVGGEFPQARSSHLQWRGRSPAPQTPCRSHSWEEGGRVGGQGAGWRALARRVGRQCAAGLARQGRPPCMIVAALARPGQLPAAPRLACAPPPAPRGRRRPARWPGAPLAADPSSSPQPLRPRPPPLPVPPGSLVLRRERHVGRGALPDEGGLLGAQRAQQLGGRARPDLACLDHRAWGRGRREGARAGRGWGLGWPGGG
jgi:hypothetical protein